jgi:hypothetical protein
MISGLFVDELSGSARRFQKAQAVITATGQRQRRRNEGSHSHPVTPVSQDAPTKPADRFPRAGYAGKGRDGERNSAKSLLQMPYGTTIVRTWHLHFPADPLTLYVCA